MLWIALLIGGISSEKKINKQAFLKTLKYGPFIAGNTHSGLGNTVAFSWKNKREEKSSYTKVCL